MVLSGINSFPQNCYDLKKTDMGTKQISRIEVKKKIKIKKSNLNSSYTQYIWLVEENEPELEVEDLILENNNYQPFWMEEQEEPELEVEDLNYNENLFPYSWLIEEEESELEVKDLNLNETPSVPFCV